MSLELFLFYMPIEIFEEFEKIGEAGFLFTGNMKVSFQQHLFFWVLNSSGFNNTY